MHFEVRLFGFRSSGSTLERMLFDQRVRWSTGSVFLRVDSGVKPDRCKESRVNSCMLNLKVSIWNSYHIQMHFHRAALTFKIWNSNHSRFQALSLWSCFDCEQSTRTIRPHKSLSRDDDWPVGDSLLITGDLLECTMHRMRIDRWHNANVSTFETFNLQIAVVFYPLNSTLCSHAIRRLNFGLSVLNNGNGEQTRETNLKLVFVLGAV